MVRTMATAAIFIALDIVVARLFGFEMPTPFGPMKFDFQLIVAALCGYALGPWWGCLTLVSSDLLGAMMNSGSLGIFLGFTLSAAVRGVAFGGLLHNRRVSPLRIILTAGCVYLAVDLLLNTLWLSILTRSPYLPLLAGRAIPKLIWMAAEIALTLALTKLFEVIRLRRTA